MNKVSVCALVLLAVNLATSRADFESEFVEMSVDSFSGYHRSLTNDVVYNNPNDTYSPSQYVKYGHMISGMDFALNRAYFQRALYGTAGLFVLGLLALIFFNLGLLFRCCCRSCKCLTPGDDPKYERKRTCNYVWFYILCFLVLLFDMLVFYGNMSITKGVNNTKSNIAYLGDLVQNVYDDGTTLSDDADSLLASLDQISDECPAASSSSDFQNLQDAINSAKDEIDLLNKMTKFLNKGFSFVLKNINKYAVGYRMIGMWVLWGLAILSVLLFLVSHLCKSVCSVQFSMFFAMFTFFIYLILGVIWCALFTILSDFCMQPTETLLRVAPSGTPEQMITYVATCNGTFILNKYINQSEASLHQAEGFLNSTESYCPSQASEFTTARNNIRGMIAGFGDIEDNLACHNLQKTWLSFFDDGLCTEFHDGIFYIWGSQLITSFLIFCLLLTAAYIHQYYKDHQVVPTDEPEEAELDAQQAGQDDFVDDYNRKKREINDAHGNQQNGTHDVVGRNHRLPHQVQVQEDDEAFFV